MDYSKYLCPVCNEQFDESSDVVVCPDCGTPHHRECWFSIGKCVNSQRHTENENLGFEYVIDEEATEEAPIVNTGSDENQEFAEAEINISRPEEENTKAAEQIVIDGRPAILYDIAVRKNQQYYMPRFIAMSKFELGKKVRVWNFWACIVPLAWSLYRKMYKLAALVLALYVMIFAVSGYFVYTNEGLIQANAECAAEDPLYFQNILSYEAGEQVVLTAKQQNLLEQIQGIEFPKYISIGISAVLILCRVLLGLKADYLYMKEIKRTIDKGYMLGYKDDKLKMYIFRKRGVIPIIIPIIVGILEWYLIY